MGEGAVRDCAEAERTKRICRPAVEVASGTDLRLALPESATPMRLRTLTADHGSTHLRCHDPPHDTSISRIVNLFKLPLRPTGRNFRSYSADHTQASGRNSTSSSGLRKEQWVDDGRDCDARGGRVSECS